jgi:hypothetical protein
MTCLTAAMSRIDPLANKLIAGGLACNLERTDAIRVGRTPSMERCDEPNYG